MKFICKNLNSCLNLDMGITPRINGGRVGTSSELLNSVRVHFAYGSDGRSFFVEYS